MNKRHIQHLYQRIGFGISPEQLNQLEYLEREEIVDAIFEASQTTTPLQLDLSFFESKIPTGLVNRSERLEFQRKSKKKVKDFGVAWFDRLTNPRESLREKMTLFWANHFVCSSNNILFVQSYNNLLRENALGNFTSFTKKISKAAPMIFYLNNNNNKKSNPNENFARELLELFTLGNGNYSEKDIIEAARAFTGYAYNFGGDFVFKEKHHDFSKKIFLGKRGNFNGDDIIDIIVKQKQCAKFISEKIYRYFVNENINQDHIDLMSEMFYQDYDIEKLMRHVFLSDWFYDEVNIGSKIKSPAELLVGLHGVVPFEIIKKNQLVLLQKVLGQQFLYPPNVAGWKTGRNWIDSNTIVTRLRLASILLNQAQITYSDLGNEETLVSEIKQKELQQKAIIKTHTNWDSFENNYGGCSKLELIEFLITPELNEQTRTALLSNSTLPLKDFCIQLLSLPEYQLC